MSLATKRKQGRKRRGKDDDKDDSEMITSKRCLFDDSLSDTTSEDVFRFLLVGSNLTPSEFFADYWEKKPLIISRQDPDISNQYSQLFSLDILKRLVTENNLKFVQDLSFCRYVNGNRENLNNKGVIKIKNLEKLIAKKSATIQFHQPQRFQDKLWKICCLLECYFQCLVGSNVYITPGGSQGLAPHYDDVEVFILQLEGEKHWRLYELPVEDRLPQDYSRDLDPATLGKPMHDFVLKAGDLMYFPRGTIHQADTPEHCPHSTHITISTYQHNTWGDLFKQSLPSLVDQMMSQRRELRTGLPIALGQPLDVSNHKDHIRFLLDMLAVGFNNSAMQNMQMDFVANRLPPYHSTPEELQSAGPIPTMKDNVKLRFPDFVSIIEMTDEEEEKEEENEDVEEEENEEEDGTKYVYLYHCLQNDRHQHMMSADDCQPTGLKFGHDHLVALKQLNHAGKMGIAAKSLKLGQSESLSMLVSMWSEGLLQVVQD
ncbi:ribosomal oxygenase 2-like isoform X2 [Antedon mediterranea]|uniref:ribosomal oxygenase 2-like isoform X2 n=1 Tax=Antedon mediterranea TaxID=105859 RepID=UPI003AF51073